MGYGKWERGNDMTARQPAEWAAHAATWTAFPSHAELWEDDLAAAQAEVAAMVRAIAKGERVELLVANDEAMVVARDMLGDVDVRLHAYAFGDIWLRDTGPILVADDGKPLALDYLGNGWGGKYPSPLDDDLARVLCAKAGLDRQTRNWVLEGGAIDVDGAGLCVTTGQCLLNPNRNPDLSRAEIERALREMLGVRRVLWLGEGIVGDDTDGHVDDVARFFRADAIVAANEPDSRDAKLRLSRLGTLTRRNLHGAQGFLGAFARRRYLVRR